MNSVTVTVASTLYNETVGRAFGALKAYALLGTSGIVTVTPYRSVPVGGQR